MTNQNSECIFWLTISVTEWQQLLRLFMFTFSSHGRYSQYRNVEENHLSKTNHYFNQNRFIYVL